jgi:hypothetical protein
VQRCFAVKLSHVNSLCCVLRRATLLVTNVEHPGATGHDVGEVAAVAHLI